MKKHSLPTLSQETPRPRERMLQFGANTLSDEELLAVMLGSGTRGIPVTTLAGRVLASLDASDHTINIEQLQSIPGIGPSKALLLGAALEFSRRRIRPEGIRIRSAKDVLPLVEHLRDRHQEHLLSISLNGAHEVIQVRTISIGILNSCPVHPREVFAGPITDRACSVIIAHNHPSGDPTPSEEDKRVTEQIRNAAHTLCLKLLDHVIFAKRGYYSFQEQGTL